MLKHDRSTIFFSLRPIFDLAPNTWSSLDDQFLLKFLVFQAHGTFKLFVCFQHKSRSATPNTFRDSAKTFSDIAIYASVLNCVFGQWLGCPALVLAPTFALFG